jgi:hypothetical protein
MLAVGHQLGRFARIDRIDAGARVTKPPDRVHGNSETDRGRKRAEPVPGPTDPVRHRPPPAQRPHQHRRDQHENRGRYVSFHEWSSAGPQASVSRSGRYRTVTPKRGSRHSEAVVRVAPTILLLECVIAECPKIGGTRH